MRPKPSLHLRRTQQKGSDYPGGSDSKVFACNAGDAALIPAGGDDGIPVELFQILKDDAVKVLHSICQHIWKTQQWPQNRKGQFSFQSQRKAMPKNAQAAVQLYSFYMLAK